MPKKGDRIAICSADMQEFCGYGTYQGDEPCPALNGALNPKLVNDKGEVFWGCETWWFPVEKFKEICRRTPEGEAWLATLEEKVDA